jgi:putative polyhydroxyalkanoate system protein
MATIRVLHGHSLGEEEALKRAQEAVRKLGEKLNAEVSWTGLQATFKGSGFNGNARVDAGSVTVDIDLSLPLRMLKGKIESRVERELQETFA